MESGIYDHSDEMKIIDFGWPSNQWLQ